VKGCNGYEQQQEDRKPIAYVCGPSVSKCTPAAAAIKQEMLEMPRHQIHQPAARITRNASCSKSAVCSGITMLI